MLLCYNLTILQYYNIMMLQYRNIVLLQYCLHSIRVKTMAEYSGTVFTLPYEA